MPWRQGFKYREDGEAIKQASFLCGKVTLFAKLTEQAKLSDQEIMEMYRSKEAVEDAFDTTKNGLSDHRLHVHGDNQIHGKLFVLFIALILRRAIHYRLRDWLQENNYTDEEAIRELEHLKFYKYGDSWHLKNAPTKIQKGIIEALNLNPGEKSDENTPKPKFKPRVRKKKG